MNINIILPFNRYNNKDKILNFLEPVKNNITLYIIEEKHNESFWKESWVKTLICPTILKEFDPFYFKLNFFIKNVKILDNAYYFIFSDDNLFDLQIISEIPKYNNDLIYLSMTYTKERNLIPIENNRISHSCGYCGIFQVIIKGSVLKQLEFKNTSWADGLMMEYLYDRIDLSKKYLTQYFCYYNCL